jgi:hypothetical protein
MVQQDAVVFVQALEFLLDGIQGRPCSSISMGAVADEDLLLRHWSIQTPSAGSQSVERAIA